MLLSIKIVWIVSITVLSTALVWFLLGATAFFNRGIDLVETAVFVFVWIPALVFVMISIKLLRKGWMPSNIIFQILLLLIIVIIMIIFSETLFSRASAHGWLIPRVERDGLQTTSDEKFEYRIELVNRWQRNNRVRLYIRNISTGEEKTIYLGISTDDMRGFPGENRRTPAPVSELMLTEIKHIYTLTIFGAFTRDLIASFEIDIEARTARRIE